MANEQSLAKRNAELEKELAAQNRELEIEAALEKVRSRSLAMHKSDELKEVVDIVSDTMRELGAVLDGSVTIKIISEGSKDFIHWSTAPHLLSSATRYEVPYFDHPVFNDFWTARENGLDFFAKAYPFEIKNTFFEYLFEHSDYRNIPDEVKKLVLENDSYAWSIAFYKHSGIYIDSISGKLLSEQGIEILKRFARVFEQAYIRFLDLQRAESQARENQIQLALERARAQSMLMQHSTELDDTLRVFHEQVLQLGIPSAFSFLWLPDEEKDRHIFWAAWAENNSTIFKSKAINYPLDRNEPATAQCLVDWKSNEPVVAYHVPPPSVKDYFAAWSELIAGVEELKPENFSDGLYYIEAFMQYGCFGVMVKNILPEDEKKILGRFAVEFERAYTRFLDLQKAEAQAREAQIQLALERVRARTMAMQKSDELKDAAALLFQQVKTLGVPAYSCGFNIWEENEKTFTSWMSIQDGSDFNAIQNIPLTEDANFIHYVKSKQEGEQFFVLELRGERMQEHYRYLKTIPAFKAGFDYAESVGFDLPKTQIHHLANFSHGNLLFITLEPCPEFHDVFKRFAAVFEQTYTRFLDLQKAEAHAREAQIELALERVRGRTMAMHKSEELIEIMAVMFEQLAQLQLRTDAITLSLEYKTKLLNLWMAIPGQTYPAELKIPYINIPFVNSAMKAVKSGDNFYSITCGLEEKNQWIHHLFEHTIVKNTPEARKLFLLQAPGLALSMAMGKNIALLVANYAAIPFSAEENAIIKRFVNVFEQSYTRFLDLQKAEVQAREAQIETALEKVRSRSLAMHKSDELQEVVHTVFEKLKELNVDFYTAIIFIFTEGSKDIVWWLESNANRQYSRILVPYGDNPYLKDIFNAKENGKDFFSATYSFEEKNKLFHHLFEDTDFRYVPEPQKKFLLESELATMSVALAKNTGINITSYSRKSFSESDNQILKRFAKVFDQAYTRFLDLQKAEAQAREAQIEAALERVRSKAMMMQKSEDLSGAVAIVFDELNKLSIGLVRCGIGILHKDNRTADVFTTTISDDNSTIQVSGDESMDIHPLLHNAFEAWLQQQDYEYELKGEDLSSYYMALTHVNFTLPLSQSLISTNENARQYYYNAMFVFGGLFAFSDAPISDSTRKIMKRFANVFEQTYTRFLDIKKAEAQAREAKIETALEKVRSSTMAMHKSDDLAKTAAILFAQLSALGNIPDRISIGIIHEPEGVADMWLTDQSGNEIDSRFILDLHEKTTIQKLVTGWKAGLKSMIVDLTGEDLKTWLNYVRKIGLVVKDEHFKNRRVHNVAFFTHGWLNISVLEPLSPDMMNILERFAAVYSLTYRRFLDLQKAEAQAREARIEVALEKIRSRSLSMHHSEEIKHVVSILFEKLKELDLVFDGGAAIHLFTEVSRNAVIWVASPELSEPSCVNLPYDENAFRNNPIIMDVWNAKETGKNIYNKVYSFEQKNIYFDYVFKYNDFITIPKPSREFILQADSYTASFIAEKNSLLGANSWTRQQFTDNDFEVLKRIARVFEQAYIRFLDLQKAEAQAREAVKQAALDRIRADIASMRTISDLDRITPLIWNELTILGINFIRCGVFIMDDSQKLIHTFLSTPDGKAIAAFHLPYSTPGNIQKVISHWHDNKNYIDHWDGSDFTQFAEILAQQKALSSAEEYLKTIPHEGFYLHFLPFLQGMLYVGNTTQLNDDEIKLIQSVADAFSTAYARYEDFNKLEAAKQQVDNTLRELRSAQQQLIQSEKMASLGELTAGIAHEIQNPLNFVNNFSEVNRELIEEIKSQKSKLKSEELDELLDDIAANEEKINHHGKRADAIVKGMLQHSRKSEGKKEPTDINALCDEYLRLSYHGLRAKDKSFNAEFKTDFDEGIGKINIVPQDIGRVLLNLYNNSFYAVLEKKKTADEDYKPLVSVQTKKINDKVEIKVSDNGNGIPASIKEKIFQPFFTTKPTGQGTGLGLSLSYDIIKAHGGEIKVETKDGEGSEFIIQLPVHNN